MGANHLTRGQKLTTDDWATGNFLFETATYRGTSSFHVMVMSGPDTQVATATPGGFGTADGRTGRT
ncbi:MAG: hypothetical protein GWN07_36150, partial [Actinobacteria bacterium]|nr:hypothetical protein [Actinomycetota bacterium]NIS36290.1 hypothetical protein [Actinomycetota bacterium]NIU70837.1 hypothetical protein [Actinomycetota bacterium]NIW32760.1 hypothetical protein [Actinomycetota bacterium]NIX24947.1 hypothetical protein [Actinomycetota bacterium]